MTLNPQTAHHSEKTRVRFGFLRRVGHAAALSACLIWFSACSSGGSVVTVNSQEPGSEIALVPLSSPEAAGVKLKNPATIPMQKMQGRAVRISATGKAPEFWFLPSESGRRLSIRVSQLNTCEKDGAEVNRNRPVRLLMKAYQALTSEDFNLAHAMAQKAAEVDPTLAAPYIITGLAYYHEGKKEEARVAFNKAKALDPEDTGIQELLRLVE